MLTINNLINTLMLSSCSSDLTLCKVFFLRIFFSKLLQINVSLNYSSTYYVALSCVRRCSDVLLHVCTQSYNTKVNQDIYNNAFK